MKHLDRTIAIAFLALSAWLLIGSSRPAAASPPETAPSFLYQWPVPIGPVGIAIDNLGTVFVLTRDTNNLQIFTPDGDLLAVVAGPGSGPGQFNNPNDLALDSQGFLYVADGSNHRIQKFTHDGIFVQQWGSLGAQNGQFEFPAGIKIDQNDNVFVVDYGNSRIQVFDSTGVFLRKWGTHGSGPGEFNFPLGISLDPAGNVFVTDNTNYRVQKFAADGTFLTTWSTGSTAAIPHGVVADGLGFIYVVMRGGLNQVNKYTDSGDLVFSWGNTGTGQGEMIDAEGIAIDLSGRILVADKSSSRVQVFGYPPNPSLAMHSPNGGESWVAGDIDTLRWNIPASLPATLMQIDYSTDSGQSWHEIYSGPGIDGALPWTVPTSATNEAFVRVSVTDVWNRLVSDTSDGPFNVIVGLQSPPIATTRWGQAGTGTGQFQIPQALAIDRNEFVHIADSGNHRIVVTSFTGTQRNVIGGPGAAPGFLNSPEGVCVGSDGSVVVSDTGNNRIQKFTAAGTLTNIWGQFGSGPAQFDHPSGIAIDPLGNIYVADLGNNRIQRFDGFGQYLGSWGSALPGPTQLVSPTGVATWGSNRVLVTDTSANRVRVFDASGSPITDWAVDRPIGIATDSDGNVFVTEAIQHRILQYTSEGVLKARWGAYGTSLGQFLEPVGIGVHGDGEAFSAYVLDRSQPSVQRFVRYPVSGVRDVPPFAQGPISLVPMESPFRNSLELRITGLAKFSARSPRAPFTLVVTDVSGRVVSRKLLGEIDLNEDPLVTWDGKGLQGSRVAPGVYFVSLHRDVTPLASVKVVRSR